MDFHVEELVHFGCGVADHHIDGICGNSSSKMGFKSFQRCSLSNLQFSPVLNDQAEPQTLDDRDQTTLDAWQGPRESCIAHEVDAFFERKMDKSMQ
jgi:hypothetical protein